MDSDDKAIESLRREMNERFEAVDQRFEAVNQRFDALDRDLDRRFDDQNRRRDEQGSGLRALIETVQSDVKLILEHLSPTMTQVADHERRIRALERDRRKSS